MKTLLAVLLFCLPAFAAHRVTLTWVSSTSTVDHYRIYRATASTGPYSLMGVVPSSQLQFVNGSNPDGSPLPEGATFFYTVTSLAGNEESAPAGPVMVTIPTAPEPPTGLSAVVQ